MIESSIVIEFPIACIQLEVGQSEWVAGLARNPVEVALGKTDSLEEEMVHVVQYFLVLEEEGGNLELGMVLVFLRLVHCLGYWLTEPPDLEMVKESLAWMAAS